MERFRVQLSVDIGTGICVGVCVCVCVCVPVSTILERFLCGNFGLGRLRTSINVLYYAFAEPHRNGFRERVPLKHDPI